MGVEAMMGRVARVFALMTAVVVAAQAGQFKAAPDRGVKDVYTVVLKDDVASRPRHSRPDLPAVAEVANDLGTRFDGRVEEVWEHALAGFVIRMPEARAQAMAHDPRVLAVEQVFEVSAPVGDCYLGSDWDDTRALPSNGLSPQYLTCSDPDPLHDTGSGTPLCRDNWGLDRIEQRSATRDGAYYFERNGTNVHVYVMDTGIQASHDEFKDAAGNSRVTGGVDARSNPVNDGPTADTDDCHRHGTHVAGIIAGRTYGVAKNAALHPVRIYGCTSSLSLDTIIRALNWVAGHAVHPAVLNWSGGNWKSAVADTAMQEAVQGVVDSGVIVVQAAGNQSPDYDFTRPQFLRDACEWSFGGPIPDIIVAGGMDEYDGRWTRSQDLEEQDYCPDPYNWNNPGDCGSNAGPCVDIWAPASDILSASMDGDSLACRISGTSMAAPHVAGVVALYLQDHPWASVSQVNAALLGTGTWGALESNSLNPNWIGYSDNVLLFSRLDALPIPSFTVTCTGRTCSVNGSGSSDDYGISSYRWSWGDGQVTNTSTSTTNHAYAANGTYGISLRVTDTIGQSDTDGPRNVTVADNNPVARLSLTCTGRVCSANGSTSSDDFGITDFEWTWGDGQVTHTSISTTSHTYAANGTYGVILKVTDTVGQTDTEGPVNAVAVDNVPVARLTVTCSGLYCEGNASASTDDFPGLAYGFSWTGGTPGSYSSDATRTHSYSVPGLYTVVMTARDSIGQTNTVSIVMNVHGTTAADTVGIDKTDNEAKLRLYHESGNGAAIKVVITGITGRPIAGDWNGDHVSSLGRYMSGTATFYLRNSNSNGTADLTFNFGTVGAGWTPIAGDWNNDGVDTTGLYDPPTGTFRLRNANSTGSADVTFSFSGASSTWLPIAGDWNGDGIDTVGLYDPATSTFYLRNSNTSGGADLAFVFGAAGAGLLPNAGDWNGDGWDSIGVFDPVTGTHSLRNLNNAGPADHQFIFNNNSGSRPLAGDWDGV